MPKRSTFDTQSISNSSRRGFFIAATGAALVSTPAMAQLGGLGGLGGALGQLGANNFSLASLTRGDPPIKTALADARWAAPARDNYNPARFSKLTSLQRGTHGAFILRAGCYEFHAQSYCFHAGTHGPGGGDGYLYAPTLGSAADIIIQIRQNSFAHPDIDQHDVQSLIWAILSRAKFENLGGNLQAVAARLLSRDQLLRLNRSAIDMVPPAVLNRALGSAPPALRRALEAEAQMRNMFSSANTSYSALERVAVLTGNVPLGEGSIAIPSGRWSAHPDGYLIRYIPSGYSHTLVQICVENNSPAIGRPLDLCQQIAVPGNTSRQRLGISNREYRT